MAFDFDKLKDELFSVGKEVGDKVSGVSNIAKLKLDVRSKEDFLEKQFAQLGRAYYMEHKEDEVPEQDLVNVIIETEAEIEEMKQKILKLQGANCCPECGEKFQRNYKFCPICGAELQVENEEEAADEDIFEDEDVVEVEVVDEVDEAAEVVDEAGEATDTVEVADEKAEAVDEASEEEAKESVASANV